MTNRVPESSSPPGCSRRVALKECAAGLVAAGGLTSVISMSEAAESTPTPKIEPRPWVKIRGIYGGFPNAILDRGQTPADDGIDAIWVGSGGLKQDEIDRCHKLGLKVFAEFNSMHSAGYPKDHPDAAPIGSDGLPSPPPHDWQGVSAFHAGHRFLTCRIAAAHHEDGHLTSRQGS